MPNQQGQLEKWELNAIRIGLVLVMVVGILIAQGILIRFVGTPFWPTVIVSLAGIIYLFMHDGFWINVKGDPKEIMLIQFFGEYTDWVLKPGDYFFPLWDLLFKGITVDATQQNVDLDKVSFLTPDNVRGTVNMSYSYEVLPGAECVQTFLRVGKHTGIQDILSDAVKQETWQYIRSTREGTRYWQEIAGFKNSAIAAMMRGLIKHEGQERVHSTVPVETLLKYFRLSGEPYTADVEYERWIGQPKPKKKGVSHSTHRVVTSDEEQQIDAAIKNHIENVDNHLVEYQDAARTAGKNYPDFLRQEVEKLNEELVKIRAGQGSHHMDSLGIKVTRLSFEEIKFDEKVEEQAAQKAIEILQKEAEMLDMKSQAEQVKYLMVQTGLSADAAAVFVQQRKGVSINQYHLSMSKDAVEGAGHIAAAAPVIIAALNSQKAGGGSSKKGASNTANKKGGNKPGGTPNTGGTTP